MKSSNNNEKQVKLTPLGGLGAIGMNCMILESENQRIMLDCGSLFPNYLTPGVDYFIPNFEYLRDDYDKLKALIVTHCHEDHIGAIPHLARETKLDIYCTEFTQRLIEHKIEEDPLAHMPRFHQVEPEKEFIIGDFKITAYPVEHSTIESLAYLIKTPAGNIVATGDFKLNYNPETQEYEGTEGYQKIAKQSVDLLLCDSTNAEVIGNSLNESDVAQSLEQYFSKQTKRLIIALFASNVERVQGILKAAHKQKKKVALFGRSLLRYTSTARESGLLSIPDNVLISPESHGRYKPSEVVLLVTGTQAEPAAALTRMATGRHRDFTMSSQDEVIFSSRFIPGNEIQISHLVSDIYRRGARVHFQSEIPVHVTGHAYQYELKHVHSLLKSKNFLPVHGEFRQLSKHAIIAEEANPGVNTIVVENGKSVILTPQGIKKGSDAIHGKISVLMGQCFRHDRSLFHDRVGMSKAGVVAATLVKNRRNQIKDVTVLTFGLMKDRKEDLLDLEEDAAQYLYDNILPHEDKRDCIEIARQILRRFFQRQSLYKPVTRVTEITV